MKQRGIEMAIQVFIVLFVLLAVAMLVLQMVSQQFVQQQKQVEEQRRKQARDEKLQAMRNECNQLCAQANNEIGQANFCLKRFSGNDAVDLTLDGTTTNLDKELLGGAIGVCEDSIYCSQLVECFGTSPGMESMQKCVTRLCNLWAKQGLNAEERSAHLFDYMKPGTCYDDPKNRPSHWYTMLFDKDKSGSVEPDEVGCQ